MSARTHASWRASRVSSRSLAIFTRQLSVMIDAGLPLLQCLDLLGKDEPDPRLAAAVKIVRQDVEAGASLADAMRRCPRVFDGLYTNMVAAGEAGGILDTILKRLSTFIEKQARLRARVRSAMVYPASVLCIAAIVVTVILLKVIPTFATLFDGLGASLPLATRVVIWTSEKTLLALPVLASRNWRGLLRRPALLPLVVGQPYSGWLAPACSARGLDRPQGGRRTVLPHPRHAPRFRRADP